MMKSIIFVLLAVLIAQSSNLCAGESSDLDLAITIYNRNFAVIKEKLSIDFKEKLSEYVYKDAPSSIVPTSVKLYSLKNSGIVILDQNYIYDLVNKEKLMTKFIDKEIEIQMERKFFRGILLGSGTQDGAYTLKTEDGIVSIEPEKCDFIKFPDLPEGLITTPSLKWKIKTDQTGINECGLLYETKNMGWSSEYVAVLKENDSKLDLKGWVNISNNTSKSFKSAKLKLMAGDVGRVEDEVPRYSVKRNSLMSVAESAPAEEPEFIEKEFFEYHLYSLNVPADLPSNSEKQISLLEINDIPIVKNYVYDIRKDPKKICVFIEFENSKKNNAGVPLPAGKTRVNKIDSDDGSLEFIGEDKIEHVSENDKVSLLLGKAFDVKADRIQKNYKRHSNTRWEESYEITVSNSKSEDVSVKIRENVYGYKNWKILSNNYQYKKINSNQIEFEVKVFSKEKKILNYTVEYFD
ncbi:MAG TPA: DUF4139 domain-containing protein [bacterium]|nr:DUF4139 domain-containing protein [bacterium]HPN30923.1 DUF4139 domain-containing protein [bacterium]